MRIEMDELPDFNALTTEELQDEYLRLHESYRLLRELSEADAQCIHELKRNLNTAAATEAYLAQELEQITLAQTNAVQSEQNKLQSEIDCLRRKHKELECELLHSQQQAEQFQEENSKLRQQFDEQQNAPAKPIESLNAQQLEREQQLLLENGELLQKLEEFQEKTMQYTIAIAEREKKVEILEDQVKCLDENMQSKRNELEELTQLLESTQEQLMEAKTEIARLTSAPENIDRKGNSLFAEVDDQRQAMRHLLAAQKKSYLEMKKIYNDSEYEIRRLKRENMAMHTELQTCSTLFCNADRTYQEKLKSRIAQLSNQNEDLEKQLIYAHESLKELSSNKGVGWINSMLQFCKQETDQLKKQLHSERFQSGTLEEQLRNSQQNMARWRFESLKSRCILLDREDLLTKNKIKFKPNNAIEFHINEHQLASAHPRILSSASAMTNEDNVSKDSINSEELQQQPETLNLISNENDALHNQSMSENLSHNVENKENSSDFVDLCEEIILTPATDVITRKTAKGSPHPAKALNAVLVRNMGDLQAEKTVPQKTKSILSKDPFEEKEKKKTVQFAGTRSIEVNEVSVSLTDEDKSSREATVKQIRKKMPVIVKRITIKPMKKSNE